MLLGSRFFKRRPGGWGLALCEVGDVLHQGCIWYTELGRACSLQGSKGGSLSAEGGPLAAPGVAPSLVLLREFSNAVDRTGAWLLCFRYLHQMRHAALCNTLGFSPGPLSSI